MCGTQVQICLILLLSNRNRRCTVTRSVPVVSLEVFYWVVAPHRVPKWSRAEIYILSCSRRLGWLTEISVYLGDGIAGLICDPPSSLSGDIY